MESSSQKRHMSGSVFACLCHTVRTSSIVAMRRDIMDIIEIHHNQVEMKKSDIEMKSGSYREGFRLKESDVDVMLWSKHHRVIWDLSQIQYHHSSKLTQILADCSESPPGYALLQLPIPTADETVFMACLRMNDKLYISSSFQTQMKLSAYGHNSEIHGPCISGIVGNITFDAAHCFVSDFWPPPASSWIERCHFWPPSNVVKKIIGGGCHFVAIGHKLGYQWNNEWRISFSFAEQKLVYSMNHCQFLTYGLLKLFLKEVINETADENKFLCSYHMKTAVFWAIQNNTIPCCCPQNFLECFWMCFKLILKWVYEGCCPNFFIPQNNMFLAIIFGSAQRSLFRRLNKLYEKGLSCLLESATIESYIFRVPRSHILQFCTEENTLVSEDEFNRQLFRELCTSTGTQRYNLPYFVKVLHSMEQLIGPPLKHCQVLMLQKITVSVLQNTAFIIHNCCSDYLSSSVDRSNNKLMYVFDKMSVHMLKFAAKVGSISDMLYVVMYYYKTYRFNKASSLLNMIKNKLNNLMQVFIVDIEAPSRHSCIKKRREWLSMYVRLYNEITYIGELLLEQHCSVQSNVPYLHIPPSALFRMLEFLCYKHVNTMSSQAALDDLQFLVHKEEGVLVNEYSRDISWQILGICQQISGNNQAALHAYQQSCMKDLFHKIQAAALIRIQNAKAKI